MKKCNPLTFLIFLSTVLASAQSPSPFVSDQYTRALWHCDESVGAAVRDTSIYSNHGYALGTAIVPGRFGNARSFNGLNDYVFVGYPVNGSLDFGPTGSFTIDIWFRTTAFDGWILRRGMAPTPGYGISIKDGYITGEIGNREDSVYPDTLLRIRSQQRYNDGLWHVSFERDAQARTLRLWVDGVPAAPPLSDPITFALVSDRPLTLGRWENNTQPSYFAGSIDEIRISSIARSAHAIHSDTAGIWRFDEIGGSLVFDESPYRNHGIAYGTTIVQGRFGNARHFNGSSGVVRIDDPPNGSLDFSANESFTIEAWFKTASLNNQQILRKGLAPVPGYELKTENGRVVVRVGNREDSRFPDTLLTIRSHRLYNNNQWHKATAVRDRARGKLYLYVNDSLAAPPINDPVTFSLANERPFTIGSWENLVQPAYFNGEIDEVRVFRSSRHVFTPPSIFLLQDTLTFGAVRAGDTSLVAFGVANVGFDTLRIFSKETTSPRFHLPPNYLTHIIPPGETRTFSVIYAPVSAQTDTGSILIRSNDPLRPIARIVLTGRGIAPGAAPFIAWIRDIPEDQGKQVRITWYASMHDREGDTSQIVQYGVWRNVGSLSGQWDFIAAIPAVRFERYSFVSPTLYDSTRFWGMRWSVFRVSAHTANNLRVFFSDPDSGYSVDNLPPGQPGNPIAIVTPGMVELRWDATPDRDVMTYRVYRSASGNFIPTPSNLIGQTGTTVFFDTRISGGTAWFYKIEAVDSSGNISPSSAEVQAILTGTNPPGEKTPREFLLHQNFPNPFNPSTEIRYDLPEAAHVSVTILDILGRAVAKLVDDIQGPGYKSVRWQAGNISSGVYFYTLSAGQFRQTRKMLLAR